MARKTEKAEAATGYDTMRIRFEGASALIMHSGRLVDRLDPASKEIARLAKQRAKTDELEVAMMRAEWFGGLCEREGKVVLPSTAILASIVDGAKATRDGKRAKGGLAVLGEDVEVEFPDAGQPLEKVYETNRYTLRVPVRVGQARVMRTRPIFRQWAVEFDLAVDREEWNREQVLEVLSHAGRRGIGDWRPQYGRYVASEA